MGLGAICPRQIGPFHVALCAAPMVGATVAVAVAVNEALMADICLFKIKARFCHCWQKRVFYVSATSTDKIQSHINLNCRLWFDLNPFKLCLLYRSTQSLYHNSIQILPQQLRLCLSIQ